MSNCRLRCTCVAACSRHAVPRRAGNAAVRCRRWHSYAAKFPYPPHLLVLKVLHDLGVQHRGLNLGVAQHLLQHGHRQPTHQREHRERVPRRVHAQQLMLGLLPLHHLAFLDGHHFHHLPQPRQLRDALQVPIHHLVAECR